MDIIRTKKITLGSNIFFIRESNRARIIYQELNQSLEIKTFKDSLVWFYATAKAGAIKEGIDFNHSFEEFLDLIDDCPGAVTIFSQALDNPARPLDEKKKIWKQIFILLIFMASVVGLWELIRLIF